MLNSYPELGYIWTPARIEGTTFSIPEFWSAWDVRTIQPANPTAEATLISDQDISKFPAVAWIQEEGQWVSTSKGSALKLSFKGRQVAFTGTTNRHSGYARVNIYDNKGKRIYSSLVDFYSMVPNHGLRFLSPLLKQGSYTLEVLNEADSPQWTDKSKRIFGSDGTRITIDRLLSFK